VRSGLGRMPLKATLVLTTVSLIGQWVDEIKKMAPSLSVRLWSSDTKTNSIRYGDMRDADVVIVSHQLGSFPYGSFEFHRQILLSPLFNSVQTYHQVCLSPDVSSPEPLPDTVPACFALHE